ncbi:MAG: hypothetical protein LPK16_13375 [Rhodobacterales bacterium]|nr:hypothetical protein [Rhodobacterales bacterium]
MKQFVVQKGDKGIIIRDALPSDTIAGIQEISACPDGTRPHFDLACRGIIGSVACALRRVHAKRINHTERGRRKSCTCIIVPSDLCDFAEERVQNPAFGHPDRQGILDLIPLDCGPPQPVGAFAILRQRQRRQNTAKKCPGDTAQQTES